MIAPASAFSLPSFAKVNLGLNVIGKRADGFHDIFTVFQTVSLHDTLTFAPSRTLTLECDNSTLQTNKSNLIIQAAIRLWAYVGTERGAAIKLKKRIPIGAGLGGGSSNAAVALIGLCRLWNIEADDHMLNRIAADLGSDVPFFLHGGTAFGSGRGIDIEPASDLVAENIIIVKPEIVVSTAEAFEALNTRSLTKSDANHILQNCRSEAESYDSYLETMGNDFEKTVFAAYPEVGMAKQRLLELGASHSLLSGSGASVFGLFDTKETRQTAMKALDEQVNWRKFAVATISRAEYREALELN